MASLKFHSGKIHPFQDFNSSKSQSNALPRLRPFLAISNKENQRHGRVSALVSSCSQQLIRRGSVSSGQPKRGVNSEELERWMKGSVEEIVKNLEDSPLVVEVYAESSDCKAHVRAEKAVQDEWAVLRIELEKRCPDGLIFVEQLSGDEDEGVDRCWGIVIQGRGGDCAPVCYLLKTSRVVAAMGMEMFCTYFCLVKVKSFRESAFGQFKNSWLSK